MSQDARGTGQTRKNLIEELDELRFALHEGPEFQHAIPLLNEPVELPEDNLELDIPILTDACEEPPAAVAESPAPQVIGSDAFDQPAAPDGPAAAQDRDFPVSDAELEQLLEQLVAEQLPKLEKKLRARLRRMIEQGQLDLLDNHPLNNHVDED